MVKYTDIGLIAIEVNWNMWIIGYLDYETYINPLIIFVSDLVVASPMEDYFLYIDDMTNPDKVRIRFALL
jgi:hypothetical protein